VGMTGTVMRRSFIGESWLASKSSRPSNSCSGLLFWRRQLCKYKRKDMMIDYIRWRQSHT
jgi:hypothetical protein